MRFEEEVHHSDEVCQVAPRHQSPRAPLQKGVDFLGSQQGQPIFYTSVGFYPLQYSYVGYSSVHEEIELVI